MATLPDGTRPEDVAIRRAERADLLAVHRIETAVFDQPWPYTAFERFLGEEGFLVATINGAVVGYVIADLTPNYDRDIGHVKDIAVHPDAQGLGIGRTLLRRALLSLLVDGAAVTKLEVRAGNERAKSLYESEGFAPIRRIPRYYDDGEAALVMTVDMNEWGRVR
ncbi:MAG: ribosomal protein S18-alanine N-acetyltransferase [Halobacteriota archaeon]